MINIYIAGKATEEKTKYGILIFENNEKKIEEINLDENAAADELKAELNGIKTALKQIYINSTAETKKTVNFFINLKQTKYWAADYDESNDYPPSLFLFNFLLIINQFRNERKYIKLEFYQNDAPQANPELVKQVKNML